MTVYANDVPIYTEVFYGTGIERKAITYGDLNASLNGEYYIKVSYQRNANGKEYFQGTQMYFISDEPAGPANTTLSLWYDAKKFMLNAYLIDEEHSKVIADAPIVINLNGVNYNLVTDSYGFAKLSTTFLEQGSYTATASYAGSDTYKPSSASTYFDFARTNTHFDFDYNEYYKTLYITLVDDTNWPVKYADLVINFNGNTYNRKADVYGCVEFYVGDLASGTYPVNVSYAGNATYNPAFTSYDIIVSSGDSILYCDYYADIRQFDITLTDPFALPIGYADVTVALGGNIYNLVTDSNGQATIYIPNLAPGAYTVNVSYAGDASFGPAFASYDFVVEKFDTTLSAVYSNGEIIATLINDVTGQPIKGFTLRVNLNGVTYKLVTDANGQVSVSTADLAPGTYTAVVTFLGGTKYYPSNATVTIVKD